VIQKAVYKGVININTREHDVLRATVKRLRSADIFLGPVHAGRVEEVHGSAPRVTVYDAPCEKKLRAEDTFAESYEHFLQRLLSCGLFDLSPVGPLFTRKPVGRSWRLRSPPSAGAKRIGVLYDYVGTFACLDWQCGEDEPGNDFSVMIYSDDHIEKLKGLYQSCRSIAEFREKIRSLGYSCEPRLYTFC